ncbi:MAG TPA: threonine synthase, partial [Vibrio sp.]|nr:threonine synthase [Vibrio sp.]
YRLLEDQLQDGETGLFLCTAHPAKFKEVVDDILGTDIDLPAPLAKHAKLELLSEDLANDFEALKQVLRRTQ